ncbi:MAG: hypothetical protein IKZ92_07755 [Muribaculaceae bacterium]|nr:hypothetical protein [Muribaculaceae bacterium]
MKRFTLFLAAIICLATSVMAQQNADQPLSPALWKQGIARCAHYTAYAKGFAKKSDEMQRRFPQGYTLDDLNNDVYGNQGAKWEKIYNEFKKSEDKGGSMNDLKELVIPQVWKLVEPDFQAFITEHPEIANAVPETTSPEGENTEEVKADGEEQTPDNAVAKPKKEQQAGVSCPVNLPLWLGILGSLLGLCALLTALSNRGKIKEMRHTFARELERTNANLQEFSTDAADQMKALSIRLTGKAITNGDTEPILGLVADDEYQEEAGEGAEIEEENVEPEEEQPVEQPVEEEEKEVMNLFMSKPDENDDFTRISDTFEPGNSIYVLTTFDGEHGKFEVIDKPEVHTFALMMPAENLIRACSGNAIQIPNGTRIVTDRPGEAEFIDGKWHVIVKAIIHYEG